MALARKALDALRARGLTLAVAESFTGGRLQDAITDVPGCSDVFVGGLVAYEDDVKRRQLKVPAALIREHGAVSPEVAQRMARGAARLLGADVGLATTGIAGPTGERPKKPLGTSVVCVAYGRIVAVEALVHSGGRDVVKGAAVDQALRLLVETLGRNA